MYIQILQHSAWSLAHVSTLQCVYSRCSFPYMYVYPQPQHSCHSWHHCIAFHCLFINHFAGNCKCLPTRCAQCESVWSHQLLLHLGQGHKVCFCAGKSAVSGLLHPSHHHCKRTPKYMCVHVCVCAYVCAYLEC